MTFRQALGRNRCTTSTHLSRHVLFRISVRVTKNGALAALHPRSASWKVLALRSALVGVAAAVVPRNIFRNLGHLRSILS